MSPMRALLLALSTRPRIGTWMDRLPTTRRLVRRFVAGTSVDEALTVIADLNARGLVGAVTYLGENVRTPAEAAEAAGVYVQVCAEIKRRGLIALPSLKLTHLGLDLGQEVCLDNLERVVQAGEAAETRVWIDMESSAYTDRTLDIYMRMRRTHANVACVLQAYLRRTPADLARLIPLGLTVRLCKGAYREPPTVAYSDKREVDLAYAQLSERLLASETLTQGAYPGFATHDERLIAHVRNYVARRSIARHRYEFQMLYGIRPELAGTLQGVGHTVRVLVPFGEDWYGYFMRRLAERPANLVFLLKNLARR
jgi:proline dehydrogenase